MVYLKALSGHPPLHPLFPNDDEQSINCCSERLGRPFPPIAEMDSIAPVAEKDQHAPHCPWFLTAETSPLDLQSTEDGRASVFNSSTLYCMELGI